MNLDLLYRWLVGSSCFFLMGWTVTLAVAFCVAFRPMMPSPDVRKPNLKSSPQGTIS